MNIIKVMRITKYDHYSLGGNTVKTTIYLLWFGMIKTIKHVYEIRPVFVCIPGYDMGLLAATTRRTEYKWKNIFIKKDGGIH